MFYGHVLRFELIQLVSVVSTFILSL